MTIMLFLDVSIFEPWLRYATLVRITLVGLTEEAIGYSSSPCRLTVQTAHFAANGPLANYAEATKGKLFLYESG